MASPLRVAGHPLHPIIVMFPIALWVFSLVADLVHAFGGRAVWNDLAFYTMAGGLVGALLAALPGFLDYRTLRARDTRRLGTAHMTINLVVVALYALNLWLRTWLPPGAVLPVGLSVLSVALLLVSGWLGGEMVYGHGVGFERRTDESAREDQRRAA
jgi:uncharacterized membrane protein